MNAHRNNQKYIDTIRIVFDKMEKKSKEEAIIDLGQKTTWTYENLTTGIKELVGGLEQDLPPGVHVGMLGPNSPQWIATTLALMLSGRVPVPMDTLMSEEDLKHVIKDSAIQHIFTTSKNIEFLRDLKSSDGLKIYCLDLDKDTAEAKSWQSLRSEKTERLPDINPENRAALFYTSGTTGKPKGVPLSHENLSSNLKALLDFNIVTRPERALMPLPLFHIYPFMIGMLMPLSSGSVLILPSGLSGPQIQDALVQEKASVLIGVPRLFDMLAHNIRQKAGHGLKGSVFNILLKSSIILRKYTGWRTGRWVFYAVRQKLGPNLDFVVSGGAKLDSDTAWMLEGLGFEVMNGYGLTETSPVITVTPRGSRHPDSAGQALPNLETRLESQNEKGVGELLVKGPSVFKGYHNLEDETREAFTKDGWFQTKDRLHRDRERYFYFQSRRSEILVLSGGKNVSRIKLEKLYASHDSIKEIALLERNGSLAGVIVPSDSAVEKSAKEEALEDVIKRTLKEQTKDLASYERIRDFVISRQVLPRTPTGKIRRHKIEILFDDIKSGRKHKPEEELSVEDKQLLQNETVRQLWSWLREEHFPEKTIFMDADLAADLGIDSIAQVDLTLSLKDQFGIQLSEQDMAEIRTVRDLLEKVSKGPRKQEASEEKVKEKAQKWLRPHNRLAHTMHAFMYGLNKILFLLFFRISWKNELNIPETRPLILAPNHNSFLDPFALGAALPWKIFAQTWWGGDETLLAGTPLRRLFSRINQVFPVNPVRKPESSLKMAEEVLKRGYILVWFPEGQRSPEGKLLNIKEGIARLAIQAGADILPVYIEGTYEAWPVGGKFPKPHKITVRFGKKIRPEKNKVQTIQSEIRESLMKLKTAA